MAGDEYLRGILKREAVDNGPYSPVRQVQWTLQAPVQQWASGYLVNVSPSGSFAKGTANSSGTDIDLFISLQPTTPSTLNEIYESLFTRMQNEGYRPKRQNVSINITANGYDVDLVPAKRQDNY